MLYLYHKITAMKRIFTLALTILALAAHTAFAQSAFDNGKRESGDSKNLSVNVLDVYPIPAATELNIRYVINSQTSNLRFEISNVLGAKILTRELNVLDQKASIDLSSLEPGVYFYSVNADGKAVSTKRFVIRR